MALVPKTFSQIITFTRASTATYFDSAGVLQSAAIDVPRLDYDPATLAARGILIEEARTNICLQSEDFSTTWATAQASITTNATTAPDGNTTADKLVEDNTTNTHRVTQAGISFTSGTMYSFSLFVKAAERDQLQLEHGAAAFGGSAPKVSFNLVTLTYAISGGGTSHTADIIDVGNGWYRLVSSLQATITAAASTNIYLLDGAGARSYLGDGTSGLYLWGAQYEAAAFPTSYIPTTTIPGTRSADVTTINTLSPWFNATEGTFYIEATALWTLPLSATILTVNNDTLASQLRLYLRSASGTTNNRLSLYYSTTNIIANMPSIPAANSTSKMAFNYNDPADTAEGTRDGLATTSGAWTGTLSAASVVDIGQGYNDANQLCGWIRRITYYPRALSSAELQSITT